MLGRVSADVFAHSCTFSLTRSITQQAIFSSIVRPFCQSKDGRSDQYYQTPSSGGSPGAENFRNTFALDSEPLTDVVKTVPHKYTPRPKYLPVAL
jgi:hypothetical protein